MLTGLLDRLLRRPPDNYPRGLVVIEPPRAPSPAAESQPESHLESDVQNEPSEYLAEGSDNNPGMNSVLPERPSTPGRDEVCKLQLPWREARLTEVAVPADVVHRRTPQPQPQPQPLERITRASTPEASKGILDLPTELLVSIFELLVGDPTRYSSVDYRLSKPDTPTPHFSHSWSLECVSRVSHQCRATAWPLLMGTLSVVHLADVAAIARLPEQHRSLIRHLCITIGAIEAIYVYICLLHSMRTDHARKAKDDTLQKLRASGISDLRMVEENRARYVDGTFLAGLSLKRLTIFRPQSSTRTKGGESVKPGFTCFFNKSVERLLADSASTLEQFVFQDPKTEWVMPERLPLEIGLLSLHMSKLSHLTLSSPHAIPVLAYCQLPTLKSLTCGANNAGAVPVANILARYLTSLRTVHHMLVYPTTLRVLHIVPPAGVDALSISNLARLLRSMQRLYDLRICLATPAQGTPEPGQIVQSSIVRLVESLSSTLHIFELQEPSGPMNGRSLIADAFKSTIHSADASEQTSSDLNLMTPLLHLTQLEILSLVLQEERQGTPCTAEPHIRKHLGIVVNAGIQWRHAWHKDCAAFLINELPSLREVHFHCVADSVGVARGSLAGEQTVARYRTLECVWGRPISKRDVARVSSEDGEVKPQRMDIGTRTRLWESAMC